MMSEAVLHIANEQMIENHPFLLRPEDNDRLIIPAKDEATLIGDTLAYCAAKGFKPEQIIVMVNGSTDNTFDVAESTGLATVYRQEEIFAERPDLLRRLENEYGIVEARLHGKGTAMFAACLILEAAMTPLDARVFFIDADIKNISEVDPIGRNIFGWQVARSNGTHIVKLASQNRHNEGILGFLGIPGNPYQGIGALQWPLCGQVSLRWEDLRQMRLSTGYAVEMAMLMDLWERYKSPGAFCEVAIRGELNDRPDSDRVMTVMFRSIMAFMAQFIAHGPPHRHLTSLSTADIKIVNNPIMMPMWTPTEAGHGGNALEPHRLDAILPSVAELKQ